MTTPAIQPHSSFSDQDDNYSHNDADISTAPFTEHPAYGRGLWKHPIPFVPASSALPAPTSAPLPNGASISQKYLSIMFPSGPTTPSPSAYPVCGICAAPVTEANSRTHYLSIAHQAALPRAPIPSAIDRTRMGLKYMAKHGWDVDARMGLGAKGDGMLFPIVPREKRDRLGLGVVNGKEEGRKGIKKMRKGDIGEVGKLDAGKIRKMEVVQRKRHEKLQRMFYGDEKVERYLEELGE